MEIFIKKSLKNISKDELKKLDSWLNSQECVVPSDIKNIIASLAQFSSTLSAASGDKSVLLRLIRTLMKITPSSEKGSILPKI
jgi:hypothetical protein